MGTEPQTKFQVFCLTLSPLRIFQVCMSFWAAFHPIVDKCISNESRLLLEVGFLPTNEHAVRNDRICGLNYQWSFLVASLFSYTSTSFKHLPLKSWSGQKMIFLDGKDRNEPVICQYRLKYGHEIGHFKNSSNFHRLTFQHKSGIGEAYIDSSLRKISKSTSSCQQHRPSELSTLFISLLYPYLLSLIFLHLSTKHHHLVPII